MSLSVGVMLLISYLIIGLDYAVLLVLIGVMTNVILFLGPYIAVIPVMIIALIQDPIMAVYAAIIMGNALNVHPLTVITLLLAAGNIAGISDIILAVPFYAKEV